MFIYFLLSLFVFAEETSNIKKNIEIDFEELDITGTIIKPNGVVIQERLKSHFNPVIQPRVDFNKEMSSSVKEIF